VGGRNWLAFIFFAAAIKMFAHSDVFGFTKISVILNCRFEEKSKTNFGKSY
jgi:hypothetical protein